MRMVLGGASKREKCIILAGAWLIAVGIVCNEWVLAAIFSSDGTVAVSHKIIIWITDLSLVSLGLVLIIYRRSLTKGHVSVIAAMLLICMSILFTEKFVPTLFGTSLSAQNKIFLKLAELYCVVAGIMIIIFRKSLDFRSFLLCGASSVLAFTLFLGYDLRLGLNLFDHPPQALAEHRIQGVHVKDKYVGWKPMPGSIGRHTHEDYDVAYVIDQDGFKAIANTQDPDFSIYLFGDSFTFGVGVENKDSFPNIIKDRYLTKKVNVYNTGVMGYGIVQMFQRFLDLEERLQRGDLVIFTPYSHDVVRNENHPASSFAISMLKNSIPLETYPYFQKGSIKYARVENSLLAKLKASPFLAPYTGTFWTLIYRKLFMPDPIEQSLEIIDIIKRRTENKGGTFVLFFLPDRDECEKRRYQLDISGFEHLDVLRYFPSQKEQLATLYFKTDIHYNANGHRLVAKAIAETLGRERIIHRRHLQAPSLSGRTEYRKGLVWDEGDGRVGRFGRSRGFSAICL